MDQIYYQTYARYRIIRNVDSRIFNRRNHTHQQTIHIPGKTVYSHRCHLTRIGHPHYNSDCYIYKQLKTGFCSSENHFLKKSIKKPCQTKADKEYLRKELCHSRAFFDIIKAHLQRICPIGYFQREGIFNFCLVEYGIGGAHHFAGEFVAVTGLYVARCITGVPGYHLCEVVPTAYTLI